MTLSGPGPANATECGWAMCPRPAVSPVEYRADEFGDRTYWYCNRHAVLALEDREDFGAYIPDDPTNP